MSRRRGIGNVIATAIMIFLIIITVSQLYVYNLDQLDNYNLAAQQAFAQSALKLSEEVAISNAVLDTSGATVKATLTILNTGGTTSNVVAIWFDSGDSTKSTIHLRTSQNIFIGPGLSFTTSKLDTTIPVTPTVPIIAKVITALGSSQSVQISPPSCSSNQFETAIGMSLTCAPLYSLGLYLPLNENTGTSAYDASGNANTGTITTGTGTWLSGASCKYGDCFSFDGSATQIAVSDASSIDPTSALTLSSWFYIASTTGTQGLIFKNSQYALAIGDQCAAGQLEFAIFVSGAWKADCNSGPSTNFWHLIVGTWDGATLKTYVDGVVQATTLSQSGTIAATTNSLFVGSEGGASFFAANSRVDDIRLYRRGLASAEVSALFYDLLPAAGVNWGDIAAFPAGCAAGTWIVTLGAAPTCASQLNNRVTATYTTTSTTFSNIPGLSFSLTANTNYQVTISVIFHGSTSSKGSFFAVAPLPTGASFIVCANQPTSSTTFQTGCTSTAGTAIVDPGNSSPTGDAQLIITGVVITGSTSGTFNIQGAVRTTGTETVEISSWIQAQISSA